MFPPLQLGPTKTSLTAQPGQVGPMASATRLSLLDRMAAEAVTGTPARLPE